MHNASIRDASASASRVILPLGMPLKLVAVEVYLAQFARAVALGLIVEVRGRRIAALAAGGDGPGAYAAAELDYGDEAVAAGRGGKKARVGSLFPAAFAAVQTNMMHTRRQSCAILPGFACRGLLSFRSCSCTR